MGNIADKFPHLDKEQQNLILGQYPEMMLKTGKSEEYYQTLTDFDFIVLKIQSTDFGVESLIRDYALIDNPEILEILERLTENPKIDHEKVKILKLIQGALQ